MLCGGAERIKKWRGWSSGCSQAAQEQHQETESKEARLKKI